MLTQHFALLAFICFLSSTKLAHAKSNWRNRYSASTEQAVVEQTARFNPFLYALPNQLAEYLRFAPFGTQEAQFALEAATSQEAQAEPQAEVDANAGIVTQYETKSRQPYNRRRRPVPTTIPPRRRRPQRRPRPRPTPTEAPLQLNLATDPSSTTENMQEMKKPEFLNFGYPSNYYDYQSQNFYPPPMPPYWPPPYPYYGYAPQEPQYEVHTEGPPPPQPEEKPMPQTIPQPLTQLQIQIPTDENTLQLLQLALVLQQTLATAAAATAGYTNTAAAAASTASSVATAATATTGTAAIEMPVAGATAIATAAATTPAATALATSITATPTAVTPAAAAEPTVVTALPAAVLSVIPTAAPNAFQAILVSTGQTVATVPAPIPQMQQPFGVATTASPVVTVNTQYSTSEDGLIIGDNKPMNNVLDSLKRIAASIVKDSQKFGKADDAPAKKSEMIAVPSKAAENPTTLVDSPVLYVRAPPPSLERPVKPMQDTSIVENPSETLPGEKEIVATVPYYPRNDDEVLAEEHQFVGQRYIKPIGYRPESPDNYQSRRRGKSRVLTRNEYEYL